MLVNFLFKRMFFADIMIVSLIALNRFPRRSRFPLRLTAVFAGCILISGAWGELFQRIGQENILLMSANYLGAFAVVAAAMAFCFQLSGWKGLYMCTTVWFIQHLANCVSQLWLFLGMNLAGYLMHTAVVLVVAAAAYGLFLRKVDPYILERIQSRRTIITWGMMSLVCLVVHSYANLNGENSPSFYFVDLLFNLIGLFYQGSLYRFCGLEREKESVQMLLDQSRKQYQTSKENIERVNIKCHDLRHQISGFRRDGRLDEAVLAELERVVGDYDTAIRTGNPALDTILTEKSILCSGKGIGFTCMAEGSCLAFMEPADLYALFGNALDNAIEAAERLNDGAKKQISVTARRVKDFCSIHVQNYTEDRLTFSDGLPVTTKADKHNHGFGVKSMRLLMEKYDGEITFTQDGDMVELSLLLPCREAVEYNL